MIFWIVVIQDMHVHISVLWYMCSCMVCMWGLCVCVCENIYMCVCTVCLWCVRVYVLAPCSLRFA